MCRSTVQVIVKAAVSSRLLVKFWGSVRRSVHGSRVSRAWFVATVPGPQLLRGEGDGDVFRYNGAGLQPCPPLGVYVYEAPEYGVKTELVSGVTNQEQRVGSSSPGREEGLEVE